MFRGGLVLLQFLVPRALPIIAEEAHCHILLLLTDTLGYQGGCCTRERVYDVPRVDEVGNICFILFDWLLINFFGHS